MKRTDLAITLVHITTLALGLFVTANRGGAAGLVVVDNPPLVVDATANTALGWLLLQNASGAATNFTLRAGPFTNLTTSNLLGARISLQTSGTPYLTVTNLTPGSNLVVKVEVSNYLEASEAEALVQVNDAVVAILRAERAGAAFNVTLEGSPTEKPVVTVKRGAPTSLTLRNGDPVCYRLEWAFEVDSRVVTNGVLFIAPTSTTDVPFVPPEWLTGLSFCGLLKDRIMDGRLKVWWRGANGKVKREKPMALQVRVQSGSEKGMFLRVFVVFAILAAGGVVSLAMHNMIPNHLKRLDLKDELKNLGMRIHNLTKQLDSELRVLVRVVRRQLNDALESRWAISPDLANVFKNVNTGMEVLKRQVEVLDQMDAVYDRLEALRKTEAPPTLLDAVRERLQEATMPLRSTLPQEKDVQVAAELATAAKVALENLKADKPEFAKALAERVQKLKAEIDGWKAQAANTTLLPGQLENHGKGEAVYKYFPAKFFDAVKDDKFTKPENIKSAHYAMLDSETRRLELVVSYVNAMQRPFNPNDGNLKLKCQEDFLAAVQREGLASLQCAERLVRQLGDQVFPEELIEQAKTSSECSVPMPVTSWLGKLDQWGGQLMNVPSAPDGRAVPVPDGCKSYMIRRDIGVPMVDDPVLFRIVFNEAKYNDAAARQALRCEWDFGDGLKEEGWVVSHYFHKPRYYLVKTTIYNTKGESVRGPADVVEVREDRKKKKLFAARTATELLRVGLALGAALLALLAGAQEQLAKLDCVPGLIAVFLAGFGADTIKNLLTQKP